MRFAASSPLSSRPLLPAPLAFRRLVFGLLGLGLLLSLAACSAKKVLTEQSLIKDQALSSLIAPASPLQIGKGIAPGKKFHLGIRVSESFMNRAASELLAAEVVPSRFENPIVFNLPPFGTKVVLKPAMAIRDPRLTFTGACPECVRITTKFVADLKVDLNLTSSAAASTLLSGTAINGDVALNGKIIPMYTGGVSSLGLAIEPLHENDLHLSTRVPIPGIDSLLTSAARSTIQTALANPRYNTFSMLPIKALAVPGSKVVVNEITYTLLTRPEGELFVGVNLNLRTPGEVDVETRGRPLRGSDFSVLVGQNALTDAVRVWMAEGMVPAYYDTSGNPNPKGEVVIELKKLNLLPEGYEAYVRMWHIGKPPFMREYKMGGTLAVRSTEVVIQNNAADLTAKMGPNALIDVALKLANVSLTNALKGIGSRVPRSVGFPFGTPAKLSANIAIEELQTENQRFTAYGGVRFTTPTKVAPRAPQPARPAPAPAAQPAQPGQPR